MVGPSSLLAQRAASRSAASFDARSKDDLVIPSGERAMRRKALCSRKVR